MTWSLGALTAEVPLGVVTVTLTVPVPAGEVTVRPVAVTPVMPVPGVEPKSTAEAPVRLEPVTVTEVPPAVEPLVGLTLETTGTRDGPVGAPENSSRLALEAAPSVKSRLPLPMLRSDVGPLSVAKRFDEPPATV